MSYTKQLLNATEVYEYFRTVRELTSHVIHFFHEKDVFPFHDIYDRIKELSNAVLVDTPVGAVSYSYTNEQYHADIRIDSRTATFCVRPVDDTGRSPAQIVIGNHLPIESSKITAFKATLYTLANGVEGTRGSDLYAVGHQGEHGIIWLKCGVDYDKATEYREMLCSGVMTDQADHIAICGYSVLDEDYYHATPLFRKSIQVILPDGIRELVGKFAPFGPSVPGVESAGRDPDSTTVKQANH